MYECERPCPICRSCAFVGDKHSFPQPNDKIETDEVNPAIKHIYCCCGDSQLYNQDVTYLNVATCQHYEEM